MYLQVGSYGSFVPGDEVEANFLGYIFYLRLFPGRGDTALAHDHVFPKAEAAANGVRITNQSATENLVLLKHFGPGNPQAPLSRPQ